MAKHRAIHANPEAGAAEQYFDNLYSEARDGSNGMALDSARVEAVGESALARVSQEDMPTSVQRVMDALPEDRRRVVLDSVLRGMSIFEREHGVLPTGDVILAALQQGHSVTDAGLKAYGVMDNVGSSAHHDQISAQPNRAVVAITAALAEAIPFATYLPTDIGSNEARLAIVQHQAGSAFGGYALNEIMDGINVGKSYVSAERRIELTLAGDRLSASGQVFTTEGGSTAVQVLRGRTLVFVNGFLAATENPNVSPAAAQSPISGSIRIGSTDYTIAGTGVTIATGAIALTFSPALPSGTKVHAEAFIDYEAAPSLAPEITTQVTSYSLFATPWRVRQRQTIDAKTQYSNEIGVDLASEALFCIRNQFAMERHYAAIAKLKALGVNAAKTYDFDFTNQRADKTRAEIWQDFQAILGAVDQQMAEDTMDHGVTHLYVAKNVAAQMLGLPSTLFQASGIVARPSVYRLGTLFGRYEVYYTPKGLTEGAQTSEILAIGRSPQAARCPIVLGDAVPPTYLPLSFGDDMKTGNAFYARNFTSVNPHQPSARGAALISVTNLFA